jgi:hypothetical protein
MYQSDVFSRSETAKYLGIGKGTLDKLDIPTVQVRRRVIYRRVDVEDWLANHAILKRRGK